MRDDDMPGATLEEYKQEIIKSGKWNEKYNVVIYAVEVGA